MNAGRKVKTKSTSVEGRVKSQPATLSRITCFRLAGVSLLSMPQTPRDRSFKSVTTWPSGLGCSVYHWQLASQKKPCFCYTFRSRIRPAERGWEIDTTLY